MVSPPPESPPPPALLGALLPIALLPIALLPIALLPIALLPIALLPIALLPIALLLLGPALLIPAPALEEDELEPPLVAVVEFEHAARAIAPAAPIAAIFARELLRTDVSPSVSTFDLKGQVLNGMAGEVPAMVLQMLVPALQDRSAFPEIRAAIDRHLARS